MGEIVIIIVPRIDSSGPVKGAIALHNMLKNHVQTIILPIFDSKYEYQDLNICYSVSNAKNIIAKFFILRRALSYYHKNAEIKAVFTFCIQPDILFAFSGFSRSIGISSIRANNWLNYRYSFGNWFGPTIAFLHYLIVGLRYKKITLLSFDMPFLFKSYFRKKMVVIPNFIDEREYHSQNHSEKNTAQFQIIFVGGLTNRKSVDVLIEAVSKCVEKFADIELVIVGDGPERNRLQKLSEDLKVSKSVVFHGHLNDPISLLRQSDLFVLPSRSEGIPRAAMEALLLGVPVVLRDVDANKELILSERAGSLFTCDSELEKTLLRRIYLSNMYKEKESENLLPEKFRAVTCMKKYIDLINFYEDD